MKISNGVNKKISTPIAIIIIIVCAVSVAGLVVWQYLETPKGEESEEIFSQQKDSPKIKIGQVQTIDDTLANSISIIGSRGAYSDTYKNYEHEFEIKYPTDEWSDGWASLEPVFGLCRRIQELEEIGYCLYSFVLYLDDEYINYDWDRESIKDFSIKGYWEFDYPEERDKFSIIIAVDKTKKITTDSGNIGHIGTGNMSPEKSGESLPIPGKFVIFPLKSNTKVLVLFYDSFEDFEEKVRREIGGETGIEIKEETKIEIEKTFNQVFSNFRFTEVEEQCRYGKGKYEMRIYDSQEKVTGLVNGEIKEEIPDSFYHKEYYVFPSGIYPQTINIFDPEGSYVHEIFGLTKGNYKFRFSFTLEGKNITFYADNIPISPEETHQYHFDWEALAQGKDGATLLIDADNDGVFEKTIKSDIEFTCEEFIKEL